MRETHTNAASGSTTCESCGRDVPAGLESKRNLTAPPHDRVFCLDCERMDLATDLYAAEAVLGTVERAVAGALEYVHGSDIIATVARVVSNASGGRKDSIAELERAAAVNRERRQRAQEGVM